MLQMCDNICKMHEYTLIIVPRLVTFTSEHWTSKTGQSDPGWWLGGDPGVCGSSSPFKKKKCPMKILCISLFLSIVVSCLLHVYLVDIHLYTHNSWWWVLYGVLVFMYLQINDGVAGRCILYSTSFHCNYGNCSHRIVNTITGSKFSKFHYWESMRYWLN